MAERGVIVSHQTIRIWIEKFGRIYGHELRRRSRRRFSDKWHLDECVVSINGKRQWLWRAVDENDFVLDVLAQSRRDKKAAKRLMIKLVKGQGIKPRVMITDKLAPMMRQSERSYRPLNTDLIRT